MTTHGNDARIQERIAASTQDAPAVENKLHSTVRQWFDRTKQSALAGWHDLPIWARDCLTAAIFAVGWFGGWQILSSTTLWYPVDIAAYWRVGAWMVFGLATRRVAPRLAFWMIIVFFPLTYGSSLHSFFHFIPLVFAGYIGTRHGRINPIIAAIATAISTLVFTILSYLGWSLEYPEQIQSLPWVFGYARPSRLALYLSLTVGSAILGTVMRRLADTSISLAERNRELERLHAVESQRAVAVERTRIARELHDVITHHLTAIVIRAQAAHRVAGNTPQAPAEAVEWIAEAGRECLTSLRSIVKVLKDDGDEGPGMLAAPVLEDIYDAADRMAQAGLKVQVHFPDSHPQYPPLVELALVRITQEALTNVLKHSAAPSATVTLVIKANLVLLTIHDPGPQRSTDWTETNLGVGSGLANMTQRAEAVNGALVAGPDGAGGWLVRVALPTQHLRSDSNATAEALDELAKSSLGQSSATTLQSDRALVAEEDSPAPEVDYSQESEKTAQFTTPDVTEELPMTNSSTELESEIDEETTGSTSERSH